VVWIRDRWKYAISIKASQVVPPHTHWAISGGPTGLGLKIKPPFKVREDDHDQNPSFF